jgi:ribosomal protein S12 methylthiotransferase
MQREKVHIVSLGCPKNLIDSEVMAGILDKAGYVLTESPEQADILLVNTCAFILPAREEAIAEIFRLAAWKQSGKIPCPRLVVTGCLPQRHGRELEEALPEVDLFLGTAEVPRIARHLNALMKDTRTVRGRRAIVGPPNFLMNARHRRLISTTANSSYIKIADGCSNHCSYCVIPAIRGESRSRPMNDILREAEGLADRGIRELIVTGQDTTAYGRDRSGRPTLDRLLHELCGIDGLSWIRLLYTHPAHLTEAVLRTIAAEEKICKYLDIPIQHSHDAILSAMNRGVDEASIRGIIATARNLIPGVALRTSIIVGFPGETPSRFGQLLDFLRQIRFDHLGVFTYSREEGTPAAALPARISERERQRRRDLVMEEQAQISREINAGLVGTVQEALVEGPDTVAGYSHVGRCRRQSPEIDGVTHLCGRDLQPGRIVTCRITAADDYDLFAERL